MVSVSRRRGDVPAECRLPGARGPARVASTAADSRAKGVPMLRKAAVTTLALGVLSCALAPGSAPAAGVTGSWSGGKTSEYYYFAPSITIARSGGRYTGTNTAPVSWSLPQGQQNISGLQSSCTVPANTHVLKLR